MSEQSRAFDAWLDRLIDGDRPTVGEFARSAIGDVPAIETRVAKLNPQKWGFKTEAEMNAAWGDE